MSDLDVIGNLYGTDKSSAQTWSWDYLRHYEELFARWRDAEINVIEIGVLGGSSIDTWLWFFRKATIIGVDINPDCRRFARDRVAIEIGSQEDPAFLHSVVAKYRPTIVIDDGSHIAHHMMASFEALFPALMPGGVYVMEDLSFHFEDGVGQWQGAKAHQGLFATSIYDYLENFMRARAANRSNANGAWGFSRYAYEQIDSINVFGGGVALRKRAPRDIEHDIAVFERELQNMPNRVQAAGRFAEYLIKHNAQLDRAVEMLLEARRAEPDSFTALLHLREAMRRLNRFDEAANAAIEVTKIQPTNAEAWRWLAGVQQSRNRPELEIAALQEATALEPGHRDAQFRLSVLHEKNGNFPEALAAARRASQADPGNPGLVRRITELEAKAAQTA